MNKQALVLFLKYGLGLGLLVWVIVSSWDVRSESGENIGLAAALERPIDWAAFGVAFGLYTGGVLLTIVRWFVLVRARDLPFSLVSAFRLGLVSLFWSTFLPGSVSGDIVKAAFIAREQDRRTIAVATVLLDRVVGLCGLFWLVTLLGSFLNLMVTDAAATNSTEVQSLLRGILLLATGLSLGSLVFWFVMGFFTESWSESMAQRLQRVPRIGTALAELWRAVWMYRRRGKYVACALGLSLVGHCGFVLTFYFCAHVLSPAAEVPSLPTHALIVPIGMTFQAGFPTPGGLGGAEWGFAKLYQLVGYAFVAGAMGSLVQRIITWVLGLVGYLVYLRIKLSLPAKPAFAPVQSMS